MSGPRVSVVHSARLVTATDVVDDAWVLFDGATVRTRGTGDGWRDEPGARAAQVTDAAGRWLTPGFIDLHCHGGGGAAVEEGAEAIATLLAVHRRHGTTRSVLSLVTASIDALEERLGVIAAVARRDPHVLGAHLEGPFLDDGFRGAHDPTLLRSPEPADLDRLLEASEGQLRQLTLAPEVPGAFDAIARLTAAGVAVAVGHTAADYDVALAAFDHGATILTHAFNGMRGIHHRAPGPVVAAMHDGHVTLELIMDGTHVHPDVARLAFRGAPGRIALITDAMAATGADDGEYVLGSLEVSVVDGVARLRENGAIAGSTLTLDDALRRTVRDGRIGIVEAVAALTATPARAIGRGADLGALEPGFAADAVLLDADLSVAGVWGGGERWS